MSSSLIGPFRFIIERYRCGWWRRMLIDVVRVPGDSQRVVFPRISGIGRNHAFGFDGNVDRSALSQFVPKCEAR